jgi:signal transduction histidine kinase
MGDVVNRSRAVLIIADDAVFVRELTERWQSERNVPGITSVSTDRLAETAKSNSDLVIVGPLLGSRLPSALKALELMDGAVPVVCVFADAAQVQAAKARYPRLLVMRQHEHWLDSVLLLAAECFRRAEWSARARKSEQTAGANARYAALGRYMLENRHDFNNLLTSVLGNSELLLMDGQALPGMARDQIETIHEMALHMHEIMQRFSSVASEMRLSEKSSQTETRSLSHGDGASS